MILKADKLSIGYDKSIVQDISFEIKPGELICLMGANGCGKTTLLRTLSGLLSSLSGDIFLADRNLSSFSPLELAKKVSLVLTDKPSLEKLKVEEVVSLGRYPHLGFWGKLQKEDQSIVTESLELLKLESLKKQYFQELSDGQKQKVFIARALAQDTPFIFLDEPTTFLDIGHRMEILKILESIAKFKEKALLFTSHDFEFVMEMEGSVWLLDNDKKLHQGLVEDMILSGLFEKTFGVEGFEFDYERGVFRSSGKDWDNELISGEDPLRVLWTKRAFSKNQLQISRSLIVKENSWIYEGQEFSSIGELVNTLKDL